MLICASRRPRWSVGRASGSAHYQSMTKKPLQRNRSLIESTCRNDPIDRLPYGGQLSNSANRRWGQPEAPTARLRDGTGGREIVGSSPPRPGRPSAAQLRYEERQAEHRSGNARRKGDAPAHSKRPCGNGRVLSGIVSRALRPSQIRSRAFLLGEQACKRCAAATA